MNTLPFSINVRGQPVQHGQKHGADLEPVHVRIGAQDDLAPPQGIDVKGANGSLLALDFTSTPQPSTLIRSVMISLLKILS